MNKNFLKNIQKPEYKMRSSRLPIPWRNMAAAAKSLQSCPTLCNPTDGSPPGSPIPGILQARTLEWVAISFSNARKWRVKVKSLIRVRLLATPRTAAHQAPPSLGFSWQEHWSGVLFTGSHIWDLKKDEKWIFANSPKTGRTGWKERLPPRSQ